MDFGPRMHREANKHGILESVPVNLVFQDMDTLLRSACQNTHSVLLGDVEYSHRLSPIALGTCTAKGSQQEKISLQS